MAVLVVAVLAVPALAAGDIDWALTPPASGEVVGDEVRVEGPGTHHLLTIVAPDISGDSYAIAGSVRFENVGGTGYLEMWSHFADGGAYFSRTLDTQGPRAALSGDSEGRPFELPFLLNGAAGPERLEINLVLPAGGTVWIGPLDLADFGPSTAWWSERYAAAIGATGGTLAGLAGALIGILGGRRKSRRVVEALLFGGLAIGLVLIVVGLVALSGGQPRHVWYPVGLLGTILAAVDGLLIPTMRRAYAAAELQRMRALDA
jgi:hypothetical protein